MGWQPAELGRPEVLILSTQGGIRQADGSALALGYHTGHWEVGLLMEAAAQELRARGLHPVRGLLHRSVRRPDAGHDGDDGQPAVPQRRGDGAAAADSIAADATGVIGVGTCDKGLPADADGAGRVARSRHGRGARRRDAAADRRRRCRRRSDDRRAATRTGSSRSRRPRSWAAARARRRAAAASFSAPPPPRRSWPKHWAWRCRTARWRPSGQPIWRDVARRSARAVERMIAARPDRRATSSPTRRSANAMAVHAAFGGSTNLLLHVPAIAHAAGRPRPTVDDWIAVNRRVPRLVDSLPNGPHPTVRVFLAGGVPEVMLHLRRLGLIDGAAMTVTGERLDAVLDWWAGLRAPRAAARAAARSRRRRP